MTLTTKTDEKFYHTIFYDIGIEEKEIRDLLCENIGLIADDLTVISPEFPLPSGRFIDILCKENTSNKLVVIELKRGVSKKLIGQAISYAAEIEKFFDDGKLNLLNLDEYTRDTINKNKVRIILVSTDNTREFDWTIKKLQKLNLDIQHVKIIPYESADRFTDGKVLLDFKNETPGFTPKQSTEFKPKSKCYELKIKELDSETNPVKVKYCVKGVNRNKVKDNEIQEYNLDNNTYKAKFNGKYIQKSPTDLPDTIWTIVKYLITKNIEPLVNTKESKKFLDSLSVSFDDKINNKNFVKRAKIEKFKSEPAPTKCFIDWRHLYVDDYLFKFDGLTYSVLCFQTIADKEYLEKKFKKFYGIEFVTQLKKDNG